MSRRLLLPLELAVLLVAALQVWDVGTITWARLNYGYDLEWMEGATLLSGLRAHEGLPFYTLPQVDYIPFIYPPVYAWLLGVLGYLFPIGYALGRSVSVVGTLVAAAALVYGAREAGARWALAIGCAALFLGTYEDAGTFFDLVRIDGLAIGLLAWAWVLAAGGTRRRALLGGLLLAAAFCTKHHAAIFGFPIGLALWRRFGTRHAATFAAAAVIPALTFTIALQVASGGLFLTYLLEVPSSHGMVADRLLPWVNVRFSPNFTFRSGGAMMECVLAGPLIWLAAIGAPRWVRAPSGPYWLATAGTALVTVSLMRGHTGGYLNVLIPMLWVQSLVPALAAAAAAPRRPWMVHGITALVAAQLWQGRADLARYAPTPADQAAGDALIAQLRTLPEPLLIPHAPYYAVLAGKAPSFSLICLWDINHEGGPFMGGVGRIRNAMRTHHWATIVLPDDKLGYDLKEGYVRSRDLSSRVFNTRTGWSVRLRQIWTPKPGGGPRDREAVEAPDDPSSVPE